MTTLPQQQPPPLPQANKGSMLQNIVGLFARKKLTKEEKEHLQIMERQREIEKSEIREEWNIVFGEGKPLKKKDIFKLQNITLREIWMSPNFLFNCIIAFKPDECFHSIETYVLQWSPPGCT